VCATLANEGASLRLSMLDHPLVTHEAAQADAGRDRVLGGPRRPLCHSTGCRQRLVPRAPRRAFGDRPQIRRQRLRHALALIRLPILRPVGPGRVMCVLLTLQHGVPPAAHPVITVNRCIMADPCLQAQTSVLSGPCFRFI
jgi:hypothetical protein